jgi:hypothetical protein
VEDSCIRHKPLRARNLSAKQQFKRAIIMLATSDHFRGGYRINRMERGVVALYYRHELWNFRDLMTEIADTFDSAFTKAVDLGNRLADKDKDADLWDIADGLLAGALQYWLYSRQPCGDPRCQDCMPISTAEGRMAELKRLMEQLATESEYFHTPTDANAGRA